MGPDAGRLKAESVLLLFFSPKKKLYLILLKLAEIERGKRRGKIRRGRNGGTEGGREKLLMPWPILFHSCQWGGE